MHRILSLFLLFLCLAIPAQGADTAPVLAAGGGYKKMVAALAEAYKAETGNGLQLIFGNMGAVTAQAKTSGNVDLVLGADFFLNRGDLTFSRKVDLGRGRLVLAWTKKFSPAGSPADSLRSEGAKRIALPDVKKAIYGRAASQYLQHMGLSDELAPKLVAVAGVPQVYSYLNLDEVDLGFMNLTYTLSVKDSLGGYVELPLESYAPIHILVGVLGDAPHAAATEPFFAFLATDMAQKLIRDYGL